MKKVEVTNKLLGICHMQVCAEKDASDEDILLVCNSENPSGTTNGWSVVIRASGKYGPGPVQCSDHKNRLHFLVAC